MRMLVALLACGCGRIGFDESDPGDRTYPTFSPCPSDLVFLGDALCVGNAIEITAASDSQQGAVWIASPYPTDRDLSLRITFAFLATDIPGDGAAIVMQNDPRGLLALGGGGQGLGYQGIAPSIAVELDTLVNGNEIDGEHVGIDVNGMLDGASIAVDLAPVALTDGTPFTVWVDYDASTRRVRGYLARGSSKPSTPLVSATADLADVGAQMWVGLTAATGVYGEIHRVLAWTVDVAP